MVYADLANESSVHSNANYHAAAVGECLRMEAQQLCLDAVQLLVFTMQSCAEGVAQEQRRMRTGLDREL